MNVSDHCLVKNVSKFGSVAGFFENGKPLKVTNINKNIHVINYNYHKI